MKGAVFLDRDGTLVADPPPGYLHDPALVRLLPGVADGLARLARGGWPLVVVSNQSGIARGVFPRDAFHAVMERLGELLARRDVRLAAAYFCPHHPDFTGPCPCRKPGLALFEAAARDLGLDLAHSWFVGDRLKDAEPSLRLGGRGILIAPAAGGTDEEVGRARDLGIAVVPDFGAAARLIAPDAAE